MQEIFENSSVGGEGYGPKGAPVMAGIGSTFQHRHLSFGGGLEEPAPGSFSGNKCLPRCVFSEKEPGGGICSPPPPQSNKATAGLGVSFLGETL